MIVQKGLKTDIISVKLDRCQMVDIEATEMSYIDSLQNT